MILSLNIFLEIFLIYENSVVYKYIKSIMIFFYF